MMTSVKPFQPVSISELRATQGAVRKRFTLTLSAAGLAGDRTDDSPLVKDKTHKLSIGKGLGRVLTFDSPAAFGDYLKDVPTNAAIIAGVPNSGDDTFLIGTEGKLAPGEIGRTKENFGYADAFPLLIDDDSGQSTKPEHIIERFLKFIPEARGAAWVATPSSSACIYRDADGKEVKGANRWHLYLMCTGDVARFRGIFDGRMWLGGGGHSKLSKSSSIIADLDFDIAPMSPQALHYEAPADLPKGFTQAKPDPVVQDGGVFDLDTLPELTAKELETIEAVKAAERHRLKPEQLERVAKTIQREQGVSPERAKAIAPQRVKDIEQGALQPDHVLYFDAIGAVRVRDVSADHNGLTLSDPEHGGSKGKAKFYWNNGGWRIHSFKKGGKVFRAAKQARSSADDVYRRWKEAHSVPGVSLAGYFSEHLGLMPRFGLLNLSGACGTGKTTALASIAEMFDQGLYFTSRESTAESASLTIFGEGHYRKNRKGWKRGDSFGACIAALNEDNSIAWGYMLDPEKHTVLILDEVETILDWAQHQGDYARNMLGRLIRQASLVVLASATACRHDLQFFETVKGANAVTLKIDTPPQKKTVAIHRIPRNSEGGASFNEPIKRAIEAALRGERQALLCSGQKLDSARGTAFIEHAAIAMGLSPSAIIRLDSQTIRDPNRPEFRFPRKSPADQQAMLEGAVLVLGSESIRDGVSFVTEAFPTVKVIDGGSLSLDTLIQFPARFRRAKAVEYYVSEKYLTAKAGGITDPVKLKRVLMRNGRTFDEMRSNAVDSLWLDYQVRAIALHNLTVGHKGDILENYHRDLGHAVKLQDARCGLKDSPQDDERSRWERLLKDSTALYNRSVYGGDDIGLDALDTLRRSDEIKEPDYFTLLKGGIRQQADLFELAWDDEQQEMLSKPVAFKAGLIDQVQRQRLAKGWRRSHRVLFPEAYGDAEKPRNRRLTESGKEVSNPATAGLSAQMRMLHCLGVFDFVKRYAVTSFDLNTLHGMDFELNPQTFRDALGRRIVATAPDDRIYNAQNAEIARIAKILASIGLDRVNALLGTDIQPSAKPKPKEGESNAAYDARVKETWTPVGLTQVHTLIRQWFGAKTVKDRGRWVAGVKGCYVLSFDDLLHDLQRRCERAIRDAKRSEESDGHSMLELTNDPEDFGPQFIPIESESHRRSEFFGLWQNNAVARAKRLGSLFCNKEQNYMQNSDPLAEHAAQPAPIQPEPEPEPPLPIPPEALLPPPEPSLGRVWAWLGTKIDGIVTAAADWVQVDLLRTSPSAIGYRLWDGKELRFSAHISPV